MFTTTQPITLPGNVVVNQARISGVLFATNNPKGTLSDSVTFKAQRMTINPDGAYTDIGLPITLQYPAAKLASLSATNTAIASAFSALKSALDAVAPELGL